MRNLLDEIFGPTNFVVDITKLPIKILKDYGFIPTSNPKIDKEIATEIRTARHGPKLKYEKKMYKYKKNIKLPKSNPTSAGHLH